MYDDDLIATDAVSNAARRRAIEPDPKPVKQPRRITAIRDESGKVLGFGDVTPQMEVLSLADGRPSVVQVGRLKLNINRDATGRMTSIEEQD